MAGADFARLTDLFQEGTVCELPKGDEIVTVWINKMSPFEMEEARMDGRVARARTMLAIKDVGSPEYDLFRQRTDIGIDALIEAILNDKQNGFLAQAIRDIRSDKDWADRVEILEQTGDQLAGRPEDDPEVILMAKIAAEWADAITALAGEARAEERNALLVVSEEELIKRYEDAYVDTQGFASFTMEYNRTEVAHVMRVCQAVKAADGWNHQRCNHAQRVLPSREFAARLPEPVWKAVRVAIDRLNMSPDAARFSDAPASSSASLEQPSEPVAESTPSTPEVTPVVLVGT